MTRVSSVLLVDDNAVFLDLLARFLENEPGLSVAGTARDGAEAIALVESLRPELVVIDLVMPVMSGLEAIWHLRGAWPALRIVATTVADSPAYCAAALAAGADAFVSKSNLVEQLVPVLRRLADAPDGEPRMGP